MTSEVTQAEPVAWQRRQQYSDIPGYVPQWQFVSKEEATGHFEKRAGYEYRPLYARPAEQAQSEKLRIAREALMQIMELEGEINPVNYDHDDACKLNSAFCEGYDIARRALAQTEG